MTYQDEVEAFAAYSNGLERAREHYEPDELELYLQDMEKARAAMETAWLEQKPTIGDE